MKNNNKMKLSGSHQNLLWLSLKHRLQFISKTLDTGSESIQLENMEKAISRATERIEAQDGRQEAKKIKENLEKMIQ